MARGKPCYRLADCPYNRKGVDNDRHCTDISGMATQTTPFRPGQTVRFANPQDADETALRFVVVELRGDRVLVQHALMGGPMVGQTVYALSDLTALSELQQALAYREVINNADTIDDLIDICTDMIGNASLCDDEINARIDMLDYTDEWIGDIQRREAKD